jgi:dolichyl-phosphate beta-glucosyltransferase
VLSVLVPAYNEAARIGASLDAIAGWLDRRGDQAEIVVCDDGSSDETAAIVADRARGDARIRLERLPVNRGKGAAVGRGVEVARGDLVLVTDADLATPLSAFDDLAAALSGLDIAVASRAVPGTRREVVQPQLRRVMSRTFNLLARGLRLTDLRDTQCGFKLLRAEAARAVFARRRIDGFAFDVEILYVARQLGLRVGEVAVDSRTDLRSTVAVARHSWEMLRDLLRLRRLHRAEPPRDRS